MSVSPKLRKQILVELEQLNLLMRRHSSLMSKCRTESPNNVEIDALATLLHSFYTGMENLFKRIGLELDGNTLKGESWHAQLLNAMATPGPSRPSIISPALRDELRAYLDFRHVFRHAYSHELQWTKMAPLVMNAAKTLQRFEAAIQSFLDSD